MKKVKEIKEQLNKLEKLEEKCYNEVELKIIQAKLDVLYWVLMRSTKKAK